MLWVVLRHSGFLVYQNCVDKPPVRGVQSFHFLARMNLLLEESVIQLFSKY